MAEQDRSTNFVPIFLALAVIGGIGGGLYLHEPFESSRPKETNRETLTTAAREFVPARIWQDPFTAISRCQQGQATDGNVKCAPTYDFPAWPHSLSQKKPEELIIVPVMVNGGAYSENIEDRRRRRYAVLSAMAKQDYRLSDAENIGYFEFPSYYVSGVPRLVLPYEWLQYNMTHSTADSTPSVKSQPPILLLWLDERQFRHKPLTKIAKLLSEVEHRVTYCKSGIKTTATLIGPAGSALLSTMVKEAYELASKSKAGVETKCIGLDKDKTDSIFKRWNFSIFSPTATASAKLILGQTEKEIRKLLSVEEQQQCIDITACRNLYHRDNDFTSIFLIEKIFSKINIQFFRTIASDGTLAKLLVNSEFKNRNINVSSDDHIVVLISEWDTFYGRALPDVFGRKISEEAHNQKINEAEEDKNRKLNMPEKEALKEKIKDGIFTYYYMRGLDGEIINVNDDAKNNGTSFIKNGKTPETNIRKLERAVGVNRFDYLRRLSKKIKEDLSDVSGDVGAIGVLGSDVYDKLLVLQALRSRFPKALFFTTDADVRFVHPAEFKWTHNLIVLSGYGLQLDEAELSQHYPATNLDSDIRLSSFRDSYQTAMFMATRHAVSRLSSLRPMDEESVISADAVYRTALVKHLLKSKAFEVGRPGFVLLGEKPWSLSEWLDNSKNKKWGGLFVLLCVILVCMLIIFFDIQNIGSALLTFILAGLLPVIITYHVYHVDGTSGEPLPLLWGANSLLTIEILLLTAITSLIILLFKVRIDLKENRHQLTTDFKFRREISKSLPTRDCFKIWWGRDFTLDLLKPRSELATDDMWALYQRTADRVLPRAFILALFHTVFAISFILILDDQRMPIRGDYTLFLYKCSISIAVLVFFWFLYVVVDQMRLCRALARLSDKTKLIWSDLTLDEFAQKRGIHLGNSETTSTDSSDWKKDSFIRWLSVQLLADRTQVIEKSLYYPFIILLMLIVAHSTLFDNWQIPPSVIVIIVTSILLIVAWDIMLRRSVKAARETALKDMQSSLSQGLRLTNDYEEVKQLELLIDEVKNERRGAFRSFANNPILKALLMPSGGFGGLLLLEYLVR